MRAAIVLFALTLLTLFNAPRSAQAHEQAVGFTEITVLPAPGHTDCVNEDCQIEVAHRLSIHDAESTLMSVLGARADLMGDREAQGRFEAYVAENFALRGEAAGADLSLTLLGGEVERGYYWVYQEGIIQSGETALILQQTVLAEFIPNQTNRVNIRYQGGTKTLIFKGAGRAQTFSFR